MYKRLFSIRVKDKGETMDTNIQDLCETDFEYMIVFIRIIDFFKLVLLDENNRCSEDCVKSIELLIEETFINEPSELLEYMTYFKRFCEMVEKPICNEKMTKNAKIIVDKL